MKKLNELFIDKNLTELRPINAIFVSRYRQAYRSGAEMPLIVIDKKTNKVISGNHRYTALMQEYGPDHKVKVKSLDFKNEKERLEFFVRENATHGNPLDGITKKRLAIALTDAGATPEEIAGLFNVSVRKVEHWGDHGAIVTIGRGKTTKMVPLKRGVEIPPDETITEKQYKEHITSDRGVKPSTMAAQLTRWLNNGWVAASDQNTLAMDLLREAIDRWMGKEAATG